CNIYHILYTLMCLRIIFYNYFFFFFQAEDGIRDATVTGVQTCALPICVHRKPHRRFWLLAGGIPDRDALRLAGFRNGIRQGGGRSEERRVGKECRYRGWGYD